MSTFHLKNTLLLAIVLVGLFLLQFVLSDYYILTATRMMVLAVFAIGFNVLYGYIGLMSLGHALLFGAGLYAAGLTSYHLGWSVQSAFFFSILVSAIVALVIGLISLRTIRVSFMIVTLMFAQVGYLASMYFSDYTNGPEGLTLPESARHILVGDFTLPLADAGTRFNLAFGILASCLILLLVYLGGSRGRLAKAIRENEGRTEMLGFNVTAAKLEVFVISGAISGAAGGAYALLFGYVGSTFASFQYSIEALLFTLLGGAGTLLGPVAGVILMVTMIDKLSELTSAYLLVIGILLIVLILWFPKGILGTIRERWAQWML